MGGRAVTTDEMVANYLDKNEYRVLTLFKKWSRRAKDEKRVGWYTAKCRAKALHNELTAIRTLRESWARFSPDDLASLETVAEVVASSKEPLISTEAGVIREIIQRSRGAAA